MRLDHALSRDDSFKLVWGETHQFSVFADADIDGDGLKDMLVGSLNFREGSSCLPDGGARRQGAVAIIPGGSLPSADAGDGAADSVIDLNRVSSREGPWKFIGGPTDRLGTGVAAGDIDGDGKPDPILASLLPHTPLDECGARDGAGFVFLMSNAHLGASDALDGATDGEIHLDALRVDADPEVPVVRGVSQFEDSVVVMRVSGSLKTAEFDLRALAGRFHAYYPDEFDYLIFVSNLPTRDHNQHYTYYGIYHHVRNAVRGTGVPVSVYGPAGTLKGTIHMPYRTAILRGPMLHELLHAWANFAVPTAREAHWGFSSANGQLGGFDLDNLVNHGGGRYSAGSFATIANGGNSVPYSPIELYFAGFIPPWEVPDLWVAKDGQWTDEQDASDNWIFSASDIETWSVQRIVAEHGARGPDWTRSQKSFRAAVVLLADEQFPATPTILRELADAVRTFGHPGPDSSRLFNFWEATGGRATLKMDDLRSGAIDADWAPVPVGSLASVRLAAGGAAAEVDVAAAFRDPDGDALTYRAISSAPSVAAVSVFGTTVSVTPVAEGTSTLTVTATDPGGLSATQAFTATVSAPENRPPEPVGALPPLTLGVDDPAVAVEVGGAFRDPDGDRLTYGAASSAPAVAAVAVLGSTVTVTPTGEGTATVTVTATDAGGSNGAATQTFMATVGPAGARRFTD